MGLCRPLIPSASVRGFSLPGNAKVGSPESRSGPDWATNRGQHKLGPGRNFSAPRGIAPKPWKKGLQLPPTGVEMQAAASGCPSLSINVYWTSVGHQNGLLP